MIDFSEKILNNKIVGIYHNYIEQSLKIRFENKTAIIFYECAVVFDLGIIGHIVSYVSQTGTLGMSFEIKKMNQDPSDYHFIILSRDINDIDKKNELVISYKTMQYENFDSKSVPV